ncbi:MAG: PLP-dependent aminotransferase family protein [Candidatus Zixiibacteriota bacterium]
MKIKDKEELHHWIISERAWEMKSSAIREILKITELPDVISFAGGLPAPELFPVEELKEACDRVLSISGPRSLQYSLTMGHRPLREFLAERYTQRGIPATPDNIMITSGSQQGLDLIGRVFLDSGSFVVVEDPTYLGALQAFEAYNPHYHTVSMDEEGMVVSEVEEAIKKKKPRFIYAVSNFQNPSGITMTEERRQKLVELAKEYYIPVIDDNPYGELRYAGEDLPSLKKLGGDLLIELGTFSKIISPGLRIGWIFTSAEIMRLFERMKEGVDLHTNTFAQFMVYEYIKAGNLEKHIKLIKSEYSKRRKVMIESLEKYCPNYVRWTKAEGGLFLWVFLPEHVSATELLKKALEKKVAYVPGKPFYVHGDTDNTLRLNFSNATPEQIEEGIKRLAKVFEENVKLKNK